MKYFPIFLSVVIVTRNGSGIENALREVTERVAPLVADYEIIIVDNGSDDDSVAELRRLTQPEGLPNLQVFALTKEVDRDTASWVGLENALGDFIAVVDPLSEDIGFLAEMLDHAVGADVVFAENQHQAPQSVAYRLTSAMFNRVYKWLSGIDLAREAPQYRVMSRRVVNFALQHRQPALTYRHLPASAGFSKVNLVYRADPRVVTKKRLAQSVDRGIRLLVSTTRAPMRLVTTLSLFGAVANIMYSIYVVAIAVFKDDVAPGWISLSLQQSGMFFLISLVLLVLGEYILQMVNLSNEGPLYHVAHEFTSARMTRLHRLNVEEDAGVRPLDPSK